MRFVFESNVPGRLPSYEFERRVELWKRANISHVMLQVDDGRGVSWNSIYSPLNPNSQASSLTDYASYLNNNGIRLIPVFNLVGIYFPDTPIRPDLLISGVNPPHYYYNVWNPDFIQWRTNLIDECLGLIAPDMVALDFVRTGRPIINETISESDAVVAMLRSIRAVCPYKMIHLSDAGWIAQNPILQGIDARRWYRENLIDFSCLFCYRPSWPKLDWLPQEKTLTLASTYNTATLIPRTGLELTRERLKLLRTYPGLAGHGLYTANLLTYEQVEHVARWDFPCGL